MHFIFNLLLLALFIFVIIYVGIPYINNKKYIHHKVILFIMVFIFQFILYIISNFDNNRYTLKEIAIRTLIIGGATIIGYSIFNDIVAIYNYNLNDCSYKFVSLNATFVIVSCILIIKTLELLMGNTYF